MKNAGFDTDEENGYSLQEPPLYSSVISEPLKTTGHTQNASTNHTIFAQNQSHAAQIEKNVEALHVVHDVGLIFNTLSTYTAKLHALCVITILYHVLADSVIQVDVSVHEQ